MKKRKIAFRAIAMLSFAFVLLLLVGEASIFLDPKSHFDIPNLVRNMILMFIAAMVGVVLWISATPKNLREKQFYGMMTGVTTIYAIALIAVLFGTFDMYYRRSLGATPRYNLVPFRTIGEYLEALGTGELNRMVVLENLLGNLVLFAPVGAIAPFYVRELRKLPWFLLCLFTGLILTEILQRVTGRGCMDIDDVILNSIGAIIVFFMVWNKRAVKLWKDIGIIS
ncbi:MAG: VanZ family protein [Lachnospiraceae bacterium]|nr:VanZ family protein [Lachnospiraceae bacterium]